MRNLALATVCCLSVASTLAYAQGASPSGPGSDQAIGQRFSIRAEDLAKPFEGPIVRNTSLIGDRGDRKPAVPDQFELTLFAEKVDHPRNAIVLPNGDLMVVSQNSGALYLLRDADKDGRADWIQRFAAGFNRPNSLVHREREILVTDQDGIWRLAYQAGAMRTSGAPARRAAEVPPEQRRPDPNMDGQTLLTEKGVFGIVQGHANRDIEIGPDGRLYVGVGSVGNIGVEPEPKASIQSFSSDGKDQRTVATGLRNPTGLAVHPDTKELWVTVQERDGLGDNLVPDYLTRVREGGFYGWPYSYIGQNPQPGFAQMAPDKVAATIVPDVLFEPHSSAMDVVFLAGERVPADYRGDAIVVLRGSWNRTKPTGYKLVRVKFENGKPAGWYDNFMVGFWTEGEDKAVVWGRPSDVTLAPDGTMYVLDDTGGTIWRVSYTGAKEQTGTIRDSTGAAPR